MAHGVSNPATIYKNTALLTPPSAQHLSIGAAAQVLNAFTL